ncbi:hypothetical protein [Shewanella baltica]|uniref:hypothetical protein n=2 Tax=Shewanella baltica TaxID=62322 RepID=UPI003D7B2B38
MMNKLEKMLAKLIAMAGVGYFERGLFRLQLDDQGAASWVDAESNFVPKILIVARAHYQEVTKTYPLDDRKEVIKLLKLETQTSDNQQYVVYPSLDGRTSVNQWFFDSKLPSSKLMLPDSFVMGFERPLFTILISHFRQGVLYITRTPSGVVSASKGGLITSTPSFAMASGISLPSAADEDVSHHVSDLQHAQMIIQSIPKLLMKYPLNFWVKNKTPNQWAQQLKPALIATLITAGLYLAISSSYLGAQKLWLEAQIDNNREDVEQALSIQFDFNQLSAELEQQQAFIATQSLKTPFWQIIEPLMQMASFSSVSFRNGRFVLIGETLKATSLLETLIADPKVTDAKFDNQVQKSRKQETFTISFQIKGGLN